MIQQEYYYKIAIIYLDNIAYSYKDTDSCSFILII
jgi:hypothetical protein